MKHFLFTLRWDSTDVMDFLICNKKKKFCVFVLCFLLSGLHESNRKVDDIKGEGFSRADFFLCYWIMDTENG